MIPVFIPERPLRNGTTGTTLSAVQLARVHVFYKALNYTLLVTAIAFTQVIILTRQMDKTSSQASASRISLITVALQAALDCYMCLGHLVIGVAVHFLFPVFATAAFFNFMCFTVFLMRWLLLIWRARSSRNFSGEEYSLSGVSTPVLRFYLALTGGLYLLFHVHEHIRVFVFVLYSFWIPQIVLNSLKDHRRPLLPVYIIGTSAARLAIPMYFLCCPHNILRIPSQSKTMTLLIGWVCFQALGLLSQHKSGPRWFIPRAFQPEKYDYFRTVTPPTEDDVEAQKETDSENSSSSFSEPVRECCICIGTVPVHSESRMLTPCGHFFHANCLMKWLEVRNECALCRQAIPLPW